MNTQTPTQNWNPFANEKKEQPKNNIPTARMLDATDWRGSFPRSRRASGPTVSINKYGHLRGNKTAIELMEMTPVMRWLEIVLLDRNVIGISPKIEKVSGRSAKIGWSKDKFDFSVTAKSFFREKKIQLPKELMRFVPQKVYVNGFGIYYAIDINKPKIED